MTYGCNTQSKGPRGRATRQLMPNGYRTFTRGDVVVSERVMVEVVTPWQTKHPDGSPMLCGRLEQAGMGADPKCAGCENEVRP